MAQLLRSAFMLRALTHSPRALSVTWEDGVQSTYPSTWLRASVRDPEYFDAKTCEYLPKHFPFIAEGHPIVEAEKTQDQESISVTWNDHASSFSVPWLRAQDSRNLKHLAPPVVEEEVWTSEEFTIPEYQFKDREDKFESLMKDLRRWGALLVHGCPRTEKGLLDLVQLIGIPMRRKHPITGMCFTVQQVYNATERAAGAQLAYVVKILEPHTGQVEYSPMPRIGTLLSCELDAPVQQTETYLTNAVKVAQDLREDDREAFDILSCTPFLHGRHRVTTEEPCDPSEMRFYEWDTLVEEPVIKTEGEEIKHVCTRRGKNIGLLPGVHDEDYTLKFYRAYREFHRRLNDPHYRCGYVLKPGTMLLYDNYRLVHGRSEVHPSSHRLLKGVAIPDDGWRSRWRFLLGRWSGLEDRWCHGCSDNALNVLAQRNLLNGI